MSMYIIFRNTEYAVMLADNLGHQSFSDANKMPLQAPKLTHVAPYVFATHAGKWQPAHDILNKLHVFLVHSPKLKTIEAITEFLHEEGKQCHSKYSELYKDPRLDIRIPLVMTGPYRHQKDTENGCSSSLLVYETANNYIPTRSEGGWWAVDGELTKILSTIINLDVIAELLYRTPLTTSQTLKALHSFTSQLSTYVSRECSIVVIGQNDQYTMIEGNIVTLPQIALLRG